MVLLPNSRVPRPAPIGKGALPVDEVVLEMSLDCFPVCQEQLTKALLAVLAKLAFIAHPVRLHLIKVRTIERPLKRQRPFVVENALAVELSLHPHAVVGRPALTVIEYSPAVDFSLPELPLVVRSISEQQFAPAVLLAAKQLAVVGPSLFVQALKKLYFLQAVAHPARLHLVLPFDEALLPRLELLQPIPKRKLSNGCAFLWRCDWRVTRRRQFELFDGVEDRFRLWVQEGVFDGFLERALLELADILEILANHLQQPRISVDVLLLCLPLLRNRGLLRALLLLARAGLHHRLANFLLYFELGLLPDAVLLLAVERGQVAEDPAVLLRSKNDLLLASHDVQ